MAKLTREQLGVKVGDRIILKGKVAFARIDKAIEGEDLVKENERRASRGMIVSNKPFRAITIEDPEVVEGADTPLAKFYEQSVYTASKSGKPSMSFESKSNFAPEFGHLQNGVLVPIEDPQKNPAPGQEVYLIIDAFQAKNYANLGSTFNGIVYGEGEIKFYEGQGGSALAGFGQALGVNVQQGGAQPQPDAQPAQQQSAFAGFGQAPVVEGNTDGGANPFGGAPATGQRGNNPFA